MTALPPGLSRLIATPGKLVFAFEGEAAFRAARLWVGTDAVPIGRLSGFEEPRADLYDPSRMAGLSVEALSGRRPFVEMNVTDEWTVAGGQTLFVRLDAAEPGLAFRLRDEGRPFLPARAGFRVEALVAAHRMRGALHLEFQDRDGRTRAQRTITVEPTMVGGPSARKHGVVSEAVPDALDIEHVALTVEVTEVSAEASAARPYVFISNLRVLVRDAAGAIVPFVVGSSRPQVSDIGEGAGARALSWRAGRRWGLSGDPAAAVVPARDGGPGADGAVYGAAEIADLSRADEVVLRINGTERVLPMPDAPALTSGGVLAPRWLVSSSAAGDGLLLLDGERQGLVALQEGANTISLPREAMDGGEHMLELKDGYGIRTLCAEVTTVPRNLTPFASLQGLSRRPLPIGLAPQGASRYTALEAALAAGPTPDEARELAHAHAILSIGFTHLRPSDIRPLVFPVVETPDVSVVIPAHNRFAVTYACLCALRLARCEATFEVVLVDDGSTDETARIGEIVSGLTVVRHETAERFIRACNRGVAMARGRYVALLNNDTEPTVGWLDALIDPFGRFSDVGLTGAMLLYPSNQLQDAGGVVWNTGNPMSYGRGGVPTDPRYRYVRETGYVSGAAMMTTRAIWDELGGLSDYLAPMYFEDTDFAFKVRQSGRRVMYAPHAVVYHHEGETAGTDVTKGFKAYQEVNRPKFKARWRDAFAAMGAEDGDADRDKDLGVAGRVLVIDQHVPRADQDAGSVATLNEMRILQRLGLKVTYLPYTMAALGAYVDDLERQGIETVTAPFYLSATEFLAARGGEFDAVYLYRYTVARRLIEAIRRDAPGAKIILMNADLAFLREIRAARVNANTDAAALAVASQTRAVELGVAAQVDAALTYSDVERAVLTSHAEGLKVAVCPFVAKPEPNIADFGARQGAMILGNYRQPANVDAVRWFVANVLEGADALKGVGFHIYGAALPAEFDALSGDGVVVHGHVDDLLAAYGQHRVFVAPHRTSGGVAAKVIGAMAAGVPCVLSPASAEGLGVRDGLECLIAETPDVLRQAIVRLHDDQAAWEAMSAACRAYVARAFAPERALEAMREVFVSLGVLAAAPPRS